MLSSALTSASIRLGKCSLHLGLQVCMLPSFTDRQRAALLACCTALLYTPINEHFGIVPLEAMAAGRPVIACNSGGPKESILHLQTGYLCEPEAGSFAAAMRRILVCVCCFLLHRPFALSVAVYEFICFTYRQTRRRASRWDRMHGSMCSRTSHDQHLEPSWSS